MKFTKEDLKDWDVVVLRNGDRYVVNKAQGMLCGKEDFTPLSSYSGMENRTLEFLDIVEVYRGIYFCYFDHVDRTILSEESRIFKRDWEPIEGETCFVACPSSTKYYYSCEWSGHTEYEELLSRNIVFQTKEEAIEAAKRMLKAVEGEVDMKEYNLTIADIEWENGKKYEVMLHGGSTEEVVAAGVDLKIIRSGEFITDIYYLNDIARMRFREIDCG